MLINIRLFSLSDADGNSYAVVKIGTQVWMAENLRTAKYNDGTAIPLVSDSATWRNIATPGYCWYNNDKATYGNTYGALYNYYTVKTGKLCPTGWHVSTHEDWNSLAGYLGGGSVAGGKIKEAGTIHWVSPNAGATNETGFTGRPGGLRHYYSTFQLLGYNGFWWAPEISTGFNYGHWLFHDSGYIGYQADPERYGFSVRCVRDP
jgi:uncharacterized protein (TIGR02145 family)